MNCTGGEGETGISGFCRCNRKKPVPGPGTGVWGAASLQWGEGKLGVNCLGAPQGWMVRGQPSYLCCFSFSPKGAVCQSTVRVHLSQALESSLVMGSFPAFKDLIVQEKDRGGSINSIHCDGGAEGLWEQGTASSFAWSRARLPAATCGPVGLFSIPRGSCLHVHSCRWFPLP